MSGHPFNESQPGVAYGEHGLHSPEMFMSLEGARQLVGMTMRGRVDPATSQLLPLEEERILLNVPGYMMKPLPPQWRYDMVLPAEPIRRPVQGGGMLETSWNYSVSGALYDGLTNSREISLGAAEIERLKYERAKLEQTLTRRGDLQWRLDNDQAQDAYHIAQEHGPHANSDGQLLRPARVYAPGGTQGVQIMNRLIEAGADFAHAKVWVPQAAHGQQRFRQDTPILRANTVGQLRSAVSALRAVAAEGLLPARADAPVGIPIAGAPGAFIAQTQKGSFNGEMANFWAEPIRLACNSLPLRAGQLVTREWVNEAALRTRTIAQQRAGAAHINPACHAVVLGQDPRVIINAARW